MPMGFRVAVGLLCVVISSGTAFAQRGGAARAANLEMTVDALTHLHELELTKDQLIALRKLAGQVTPAKAPAQGKTTPAYLQALQTLRAALASDDEEKISDAQDKVDELRDELNIDPQTDVDPTESACKHAGEALNLLTAAQVAGYIAEHSDDVPDAVATMMDALDDVREPDFAMLKAEAAGQVATLLAGLNSADQAPIVKKVNDWLDHAAAMSDDDIKRNHAKLEADAKKIVGQGDPMVQLRHWLEREMADLLSNPELPAALAARAK